jgi:hypothetical protein
MAFVNAMNAPQQSYGVKGADCYTHSGSKLVDLFTQLVRGAFINHTLVNECLAESVEDTLVLAFQTRDVRGGKGERVLFRKLLTAILKAKPELAWSLCLVPEYGRWDDVWSFMGQSLDIDEHIDNIVSEQFQLDQESDKPSLLVKWLPREGSKQNSLALHFANVLFPLTPMNGRLRMYRKTLAFLNNRINTAEVKMCGKNWSSIAPGSVPGQLLKRNKHAFFNKRPLVLRRKVVRLDDRFPNVPDRVTCANNFKEHMASGRSVAGGQTTMPNEHVRKILKEYEDKDMDSIIQAQWSAIREETLKAGGLGDAVFMCDFSGSMDGVPKEVSLALGILGSEVAAPAFKDHILTFDSTPRWHSFKGLTTLRQKVESVGNLGQGTSTDFQAACELVLKRLVENNVPAADAPKQLIVITDMGFDAASTDNYVKKSVSWETQFQMVRGSFQTHGYEPPLIVCWNVSSAYKDTHAKAHEVGVVQLSGWSPSVLKALQGGLQVETPYDGLRALLDSPRYDPVRRGGLKE